MSRVCSDVSVLVVGTNEPKKRVEFFIEFVTLYDIKYQYVLSRLLLLNIIHTNVIMQRSIIYPAGSHTFFDVQLSSLAQDLIFTKLIL